METIVKLVWIKYRTKKKQIKHKLFLYIGEKDNKLCLANSEKISPGEARAIKENIKRLKLMTTQRRLDWMKANVPNIFKTAYHTMSSKSAQIVKQFPIK
jgi:hypothetical protein